MAGGGRWARGVSLGSTWLAVIALVTPVTLFTLPACNRSTEPPKGEAVRSPSSATPTPPGGERPALPGMRASFDAPPSWKLVTKRGAKMRLATYVVPRAGGDPEDGEMTVMQAGGTVEQNVTRWAQQFDIKPSDAKTSTKTVNGRKVTVVEMHGTYAGMAMPGAPAPDKKPAWALLGAIVETTPPTFLKLTGPEKTIVAAKPDFDGLIGTIR
jgi:hypothetical protein